MANPGKLFVFEGPDGVGKTASSTAFAEWLTTQGVPCERLTFPGATEGTLGRHVYALHHDALSFGISKITPAARQLLHIAAHIDVIERTIAPRLRDGTNIVLDRYWWSTKAYGIMSGVDHRVLALMIDIELRVWGDLQPSAVFLLRRRSPLRAEPLNDWQRLCSIYEDIAADRGRFHPVYRVDNESAFEDCLGALRKLGTSLLGFSSESKPPPRRSRHKMHCASSSKTLPSHSRVYDTYWKFAAERQDIFFRRASQLPPPWTHDPILSEYKFTNVYRASDRVSQFLIRNVIYQGDDTANEIFFRTILFKLFNKIGTWNLLTSKLGAISYREYRFEQYDRILTAAIDAGQKIYSGAYIMPSGGPGRGTDRKHRAHLWLLEQMMRDDLPSRVAESSTMGDTFELLKSYPMMGGFLSYQYAVDLNYSTLTDFSEMEFVIPGPGARSGLAKCFPALSGLDEASVIRLVAERQDEEFRQRGLTFQSLWGRPLQLIDVQNLFCEVDKYARVRHPEISGALDRTRIKQRFLAHAEPIQYWYPPKWGLNERIPSCSAIAATTPNSSAQLSAQLSFLSPGVEG